MRFGGRRDATRKDRVSPPVVAMMVVFLPSLSETIPKMKLPTPLINPMTPKAPLALTGSMPIRIIWGTTNVRIEIMPPTAKKYETAMSLNDIVLTAGLGSQSDTEGTPTSVDLSSIFELGCSPSTHRPIDSGSSRRKRYPMIDVTATTTSPNPIIVGLHPYSRMATATRGMMVAWPKLTPTLDQPTALPLFFRKNRDSAIVGIMYRTAAPVAAMTPQKR